MTAREIYLQALFQSDQRLRRFFFPNVRPTGRELGTGAYGSVEEVEVSGLVCAGKKLHDVLLQRHNITKYVEECQLMSDLRHPHVVQFLGICFLPSSRLPVLLMERLHTSLDDLLTQHTRHPPLLAAPDIPLGQKRSFLMDIARGLHFLHSHSPSVIHRDLTAKNVLLTTSMVAKISDLGNARLLDFSQGLFALSSGLPGTPVYMPPEAFENPPRYGPQLDIFSFGHLALYTVIQVFPCNLRPATYPNPLNPRGQRLGRTELERRINYINQLHQQLREGHPLVQLVEQCLDHEAEDRPLAEEVLQRLEEMEIDDPYQNLTRLDMIVMVGEKDEEIQQTVRESQQKDREIQWRDEEIQRKEAEIGQKQQVMQQKEEQIQQMGEEIRQRDVDMQQKEDELQQRNEENLMLQYQAKKLQEHVGRLEAAQQRNLANVEALTHWVDQLEFEKERTQTQHTSVVEALSQQVSSLREDNCNLSSLVKAKTRSLQIKEEQIEGLRRELVVKERQLEDKNKEIEAKQQQIESVTLQVKAHIELVHSLRDKLSATEQELSAFQQQTEGTAQECDALQLELVSLREGLQTKDAEIAVKRERVYTTEEEVRVKAAEITVKDTLLQSKERRIQSLWRELESLRQRGKDQVNLFDFGRASLEWKPCADLPVGMCLAQAVQLKTKVYVQRQACSEGTDSMLYTYKVPVDAWASLSSPTSWSALTVYHSQLVLAGGKDSTTRGVTNQLWVLQDEQTWSQPLPPMLTARHSGSAISSGDHLVVAGGSKSYGVYAGNCCDSVEVYDGVRWVKADTLPVACRDIKSAYYNGNWYLMGGYRQSTSVFYASLHSLIEKAIQQPPCSEQQSVWNTLPDVPYELSTTTTLGGALLAMGGKDSKGKRTSSIHAYSPLSNSWLHIGDMPEAVSSTCSITLTTGETMILGGQSMSGKSSHVHTVNLTAAVVHALCIQHFSNQ